MLIFKQLPLIIGDIEAITKKKRDNSQIKYAYRSIDEFMNALNPLLAEHKVTIVPEVLENQRTEFKSQSGSSMTSVVMKIKYTFFAEDGSNVSSIMIGEAFDSGDKASNKAQAIALKYCVQQVFMVPTEDVEDPDHHDTTEVKSKSEPKKTLSNHAPQFRSDIDKGADYAKEGKLVTEGQIKRLMYLKSQSCLSWEDIADYIRTSFNKTDSKSLNMAEYDKLCAFIMVNPIKE